MRLHRIARIHREIDDDLLELLRVGADRTEFAVVTDREFDFLAHQPLEQLADFADHVGQLQHHRPQGLLAAEGKQLPGQARGAVRVRLDLLDVVVVAVARGMTEQHQVAIADDRGQHVVEVMRNAAGKLTDRLHLGRLRHLAPQALFFRRVGDRQ